jgi:hypothetical protein
MTKGEILDGLFKKANLLQAEQNSLFEEENVAYLDINGLSESGRLKWCELRNFEDELTTQICNIVLGK